MEFLEAYPITRLFICCFVIGQLVALWNVYFRRFPVYKIFVNNRHARSEYPILHNAWVKHQVKQGVCWLPIALPGLWFWFVIEDTHNHMIFDESSSMAVRILSVVLPTFFGGGFGSHLINRWKSTLSFQLFEQILTEERLIGNHYTYADLNQITKDFELGDLSKWVVLEQD